MRKIKGAAERNSIIDEMLELRHTHASIASRLGVSPQRVDQLINERRGLCQCGKERVFGNCCEKHASAKMREEHLASSSGVTWSVALEANGFKPVKKKRLILEEEARSVDGDRFEPYTRDVREEPYFKCVTCAALIPHSGCDKHNEWHKMLEDVLDRKTRQGA